MKPWSLLALMVGVTLWAASGGAATATELDLKAVSTRGTLNGALFITPSSPTSGGTGVITAFLSIRATGTEAGVNTLTTKPELNTQHRSTLTLSALQNNIVNINGTSYYEFVLDVNETGGGSGITLEGLRIFTSSSSGLNYASLGTPVYDLDGGGEANSILLDAANFSGSGTVDMFALIPTALFGPYDPEADKYIYLYSQFSGTDDGFEEWSRKTQPPPFTPDETVPDGGRTLALLGGALLALGGLARKLGA